MKAARQKVTRRRLLVLLFTCLAVSTCRLPAPAAPDVVRSDSELLQLPGKGAIRMLTLRGMKVTDEGLMALRSMPGLVNLTIQCPLVTDAGLKNLESLKKLEQVFLFCGPKVTDQTLKTLADLTALNWLVVSCPGITDRGLSYVERLKGLTVLALEQAKVTGSGLKHLEPLAHLQTASLMDDEISDASLVYLERLPLTTLNLSGNPISDSGLAHIARISSLTFGLSLQHTKITAAGLTSLMRLKRLGSLSLSYNKLGKQGCARLAAITNLKRVHLCECGLDNDALKQLSPMRQLVLLDLSNNPLNLDLEHRASQKPYKETPQLRNKFDDRGLDYLRALKHLEDLDLSFTDVTPAGLSRLQRAVPHCRIKLTIEPPHGKPD